MLEEMLSDFAIGITIFYALFFFMRVLEGTQTLRRRALPLYLRHATTRHQLNTRTPE